MKDMDIYIDTDEELDSEEEGAVAETLIELTDEDGQPTEFEVLDVIDYKDDTYLVVIDANDDEDQTSEVLILREEEDDEDDQMCAYQAVEDADENHMIYALFRERNAGLFDFAD